MAWSVFQNLLIISLKTLKRGRGLLTPCNLHKYQIGHSLDPLLALLLLLGQTPHFPRQLLVTLGSLAGPSRRLQQTYRPLELKISRPGLQ